MSKITYFVRCSDDCLAEGMTKEQIFAAIAEATGNIPTGIDEAFITKVKESNANGEISFWIGTEAEYNALGIDADVMYIRVDENGKAYFAPNDMLSWLANMGVVPIEAGGTGATTAADARTALDAAASSHNHSAANITSGTLPVARGGTGVTSDAAIGLKAYPVNSIYMSVNSTSPASLFGGTWTQLKDRFLLGAGSSYSNGATGGAATHTLTEAQMPSHYHDGITTDGLLGTHRMNYRNGDAPSGSNSAYWCIENTTTPNTHSARTVPTGGGAAHNNMPPYLVVYMWKRTA